MKLFFESFTYSQSHIYETFGEDLARQISKKVRGNDNAILDCVGYYLHKDGKSCEPYFILPKVFVWGGNEKDMKAFGIDDWQIYSDTFKDGIVLTKDTAEKIKKLWNKDKWELDVIYELPMWIYSSIAKYNKRQQNKSVARIEENVQSLITPKRDSGESTLLDAALALKFFYLQNPNLFLFIWKQSHSGFNKIKWNKTISKKQPIITENSVIYPEVVNSRRRINWDETLMCLFFNTLRYINKVHSVEVSFDVPYSLEPDRVFERKVENGQIAKLLKRIKNNYFSDKLQLLWKLMNNYHSKLNKFRSSQSEKDYLLIKNYNNVFEDMIDELLGDDERTYPTDLKTQKDGKIVDHLFRHDSLIPLPKDKEQKLFYIGDSKYYREDKAPEGVALYKQYTYAKNILQAHFNWYNKDGNEAYKIYRDDKTEGYNVTPNFFLSGYTKPNLLPKDSGLEKDEVINKELEQHPNFQWKNRLFDRDTLFLRQYDINFLFVLHSYIHHNISEQKKFKDDAKKEFKDDFIALLNNKYNFYVAEPKGQKTISQYLEDHFKYFIGKVFCPYPDPDFGRNRMLVASEKNAEEDEAILNKLKYDFVVYNYKLGEDMLNGLELNEISKEEEKDEGMVASGLSQELEIPFEHKRSYITSSAIVGCYKDSNHLKWIKVHNLYNVRWDKNIPGSVQNEEMKFQVKYLLLYDIDNPYANFEFFEIKRANKNNIKNFDDDIFKDYCDHHSNDYLVYEIKKKLSNKEIDINKLKDKLQYNYIVGSPIYVSMGDLVKNDL